MRRWEDSYTSAGIVTDDGTVLHRLVYACIATDRCVALQPASYIGKGNIFQSSPLLFAGFS
ncbi:MAG: hypothetical protein JWR72_1454 [Flavisolibacter sp.]|nr:hypothetical protein [Flavisolibacter sp.]